MYNISVSNKLKYVINMNTIQQWLSKLEIDSSTAYEHFIAYTISNTVCSEKTSLRLSCKFASGTKM